ncbi:MAG TPA: hypothetical protein VGY77_09995 [Gemmataceae bacterium]|jgi:hypothetical protein|nr:hypothetical protein [Gemmataceae bacterium]
MNPKRKKKLKGREERRAKLRKKQVSTRVTTPSEFNVQREVEYIVGRAAEGDGRCVSLGPLVLFSTLTGDAWLLDPADHLALCLACEGVRQPVNIVETAEKFSIEWEADFTIDKEVFTIVERETGQVRTILGYPTQEILASIARVRGSASG